MFRVYVKMMIVFILPLVALNMAARVLGSTQPPNPALEGFTVGCEGISQPCWYGIVPGETTLGETRSILARHGFTRPHGLSMEAVWNSEIFANPDDPYSCQISFESDSLLQRPIAPETQLNSFWMSCPMLNLGEILLSLGFPDTVEVCGLILRYAEGFGIVNFDLSSAELSPHDQQMNLVLTSNRNTPEREYSSVWHGFAPCWRYKQLRIDNST
jgi:hypothetical protein